MKNNNVVIALLVVIILMLAFIAFKKPANAPDNTVEEGVSETELEGTKLYKGEGFSFRYDKLASVSVEGAATYAPLYIVSKPDRGGAADYISFFANGMPNPSEYNPCGDRPVKSVSISNKLFTYCDSDAEPVRTYIYKDGDKAVIVDVSMTGDKPTTGYIDFASIDLK